MPQKSLARLRRGLSQASWCWWFWASSWRAAITAPPPNPGGAGLAPPDPYAANLAISNIKMSEASSVAGGKATYIDGTIANHGTQTVSAITVQVAFSDFTKQIVQKETMPLNLIRTHQPYIDTEPVSAAPIAPGETREFRLIFDHVAEGWNQYYPEIRVIEVKFK